MKNLKNYIPAILFMALAILSSCGGDEGGEDGKKDNDVDLDEVATSLSFTWAFESVTAPSGAGASDIDWSGLSLTVSGDGKGGDYTTTGHDADNLAEAKKVWPESGTWTFSDATGKKVTRSDDVVVTISSVTDSALEVIVAVPAASAARTSGEIDGNWTFKFKK